MSIKLIICTDIFGETKTLTDLVLSYTALGVDVSLVSPYQAQEKSALEVMLKNNDFDEHSVYQYFLTQSGHARYQSMITTALLDACEAKQNTIILAFSAGASACWQALQTLSLEQATHIQHFIGFYPSQIRHHSQSAPHCPVTLMFPSSEPHFDLTIVINQLGVYKNVHTIQTPWQHGFFNPLSKSFNQSAHQYCQQLLLQLDSLIQPILFAQQLTTQLQHL